MGNFELRRPPSPERKEPTPDTVQSRERVDAGAQRREQLEVLAQKKDAIIERGRAARRLLELGAMNHADDPKWKSQFDGFNTETLQIVQRVRGSERKLNQPAASSAYEAFSGTTEQTLQEYRQALQDLEDHIRSYEFQLGIPRSSAGRPTPASPEGGRTSTVPPVVRVPPAAESVPAPQNLTPQERARREIERMRRSDEQEKLPEAERLVQRLERSWEANGVIGLPDRPLVDRANGRSLSGLRLREAQGEALHRAALTLALKNLGVRDASIPVLIGEPKFYREQPENR